MGKIRIGRSGHEVYDTSGQATVKKEAVTSGNSMSDDEKQRFIAAVLQMPKDKQVAMLREKGLQQEADDLETFYAQQHLKEMEAEARMKRLKEIKALPEDEQLPLFIAEGFVEEAQALEEKMAALEKAEAMAKAAAEASVEAVIASKEETGEEEAPAEEKKEEPKEEKKVAKAKTPAKARPYKFDSKNKSKK